LVFKLADGSFCHLVGDNAKTIASLDAFAGFRHGAEERRLNEPKQFEAAVIGNYRMLADA
jgi:hypothetical protein